MCPRRSSRQPKKAVGRPPVDSTFRGLSFHRQRAGFCNTIQMTKTRTAIIEI
jgi:hypothetical protein